MDRILSRYSLGIILSLIHISKGEFDRVEAKEIPSLRKGLIVGQAYVDAYLMEGSIKTAGIALTDEAVSYTHLDVYKRQVCGSEMVEIGKEVRRSLMMKPAEFWVREDVYYLSLIHI